MRQGNANQEISVQAIAGTRVVLLGLNASESAAGRLLGFRIYRLHNGRCVPLRGGRTFAGDHGEEAAAGGHAQEGPIQAFLWGDYVVEPNTTYTYKVVPVYGEAAAHEEGEALEVTVTTEAPAAEGSAHAVYFNRGVAGSQAYSREFGEYRRWYRVEGQDQPRQFVKPDDVPDRAAYTWLSRGLEEAMLGFIGEAAGPEYSIRAAAYEFTYLPVIQAFVDALERGVDVRIVRHAKPEPVYRVVSNPDAETTVSFKEGGKDPVTLKKKEVTLDEDNKDSVCAAATAALGRIGLKDLKYLDAFCKMTIDRTITQISHNKFIVLLKNGEPLKVWTGSTNFTAGGIFGQSNVGHVVNDPGVARKYLEYWRKLSTDPKKKGAGEGADEGICNWTVGQQPDLAGPPPPNSITPVFSPRLTKGMLDWYAERLAAAKQSVFFTAAFSVADEIFEKVVKPKRVPKAQPYLRYLLLESNRGLMANKCGEMAKCAQNRIAWGDVLRVPGAGESAEHLETEVLTGLNDHVEFLHTKYMLVDPLSDDPIVITGSANFSKNSTVDNDENMLIIRGGTRVADIYLGEFMRLFNHFLWRNRYNRLTDDEKAATGHLSEDPSWTGPYYQPGTQEWAERLLFACGRSFA